MSHGLGFQIDKGAGIYSAAQKKFPDIKPPSNRSKTHDQKIK
jgi:hypothetical protein